MSKKLHAKNSRTSVHAALALLVLLFPGVLFAQTTVSTLLTQGINIFTMLIKIFLALAVLVFFWGIVKFVMSAGSDSDERSREEGKKVMIWGMVGLFVMVSLWGIVGFIQSSIIGGTVSPPTIYMPPDAIPPT